MPKPQQDETRSDFVSRCIPIVLDDGTAKDSDQAVAICNSLFRQERKVNNPNDTLLAAIHSRDTKQTEFAYGILTADRYVRTVKEAIGVQACYKHLCVSSGGIHTSFDDIVRKAAQTLVYSNPDMVIGEKFTDDYSKISGRGKLPKNTLMAFRHVLTTSKEDRDDDILRTDGFEVDPKMLLLWQHVHTAPIGKMLWQEERTKDKLELVSCIIDINELCHDSAVMVDNDMGRFSHGFRALEFEERKSRDGKSIGGFDVTKGEIMEESLVSVPANTDAETQEILLSLVEGGKLTSPIMKEYGSRIREKMPVSVPVQLDLKISINGQEVKDENKFRDEEGRGKGESGSPEKADAETVEAKAGGSQGTEDKEVIEPETKQLADDAASGGEEATPPTGGGKESYICECLDCSYEVKSSTHCRDLKCPKCGGEMRRKERPGPGQASAIIDEKQGRALSKGNEKKIEDARDDVLEASKMEGVSRPCKALLRQAGSTLNKVLSSLGQSEETTTDEVSVKQAIGVLFTKGVEEDFALTKSIIDVLDQNKKDSKLIEQHSSILQ